MSEDYMHDGQVSVITGAGGDVGGAAAILMAERGSKVVAVDIRQEQLDKLAERMPQGADFITVTADVGDEDSVANYVRQARDKYGRIDTFFNNAGIEGSKTGAWALIPDLSLEDFNQILTVNSTGVFLGLKHVIPVMVAGGGGAIVNTSSINGIKGARGQVAYVASKHAVASMTKVTAKEWGHKGVRVNAIAPGAILGRMMTDYIQIVQANMPPPPPGPPVRGRPAPIPRWSDPREIATMAAFLMSNQASYITGACYSVDGGLSAI
jgi:NAD(P)-dependent dehydrogenase (short-subunit alcohol dehydrogenase family)